MDERLIEIFRLVFLLNQKGQDLTLVLKKDGIEILPIIPHWTNNNYFKNLWEKDYDGMINGTLKILRETLEGVENE